MRKFALALIVFGFLTFQRSARSAPLPGSITDREFWDLVTRFSEDAGRFPQQYMSNEDSYQSVIPMLKSTARRGGVYIGVGSEQNFTYIAAVQPQLSFVADIRRDNMLEQLMYKAIFELSKNRADFLSILFSRKRPEGMDSAKVTAKELFDKFMPAEVDAGLYDQNLRAVIDLLVNVHKFELNDADKAGIGRNLGAFRTAGPYSLKGYGDTTNPPYARLMAMTDPAGNQSYLASENNFKVVKKLEGENRVIPVVGDFAGNKALAGIGRYLKERGATVDVFYVSNVERYLFDDFAHGKQFYANVSGLPLNPSSIFIRSVTTDISLRLGFPLPPGKEKWRTFLFSIGDCLQGLDAGRIKSYPDLFAGVN